MEETGQRSKVPVCTRPGADFFITPHPGCFALILFLLCMYVCWGGGGGGGLGGCTQGVAAMQGSWLRPGPASADAALCAGVMRPLLLTRGSFPRPCLRCCAAFTPSPALPLPSSSFLHQPSPPGSWRRPRAIGPLYPAQQRAAS